MAVILGGDLNMRDSDLAAAGGLRQGMRDVWQVSWRNYNVLYY